MTLITHMCKHTHIQTPHPTPHPPSPPPTGCIPVGRVKLVVAFHDLFEEMSVTFIVKRGVAAESANSNRQDDQYLHEVVMYTNTVMLMHTIPIYLFTYSINIHTWYCIFCLCNHSISTQNTVIVMHTIDLYKTALILNLQ